MKYLKFLIINIVVFGIFFFLFSLLFPSKIYTAKSITIQAYKDTVSRYLYSLSEWNQWNTFIKTDENVQIDILSANRDTLITSWRQKNGKKVISTHVILFVNEQSTAISWVLLENIKWYQPLRKFAAVFKDKSLVHTMETSLDNLKKHLENDTKRL